MSTTPRTPRYFPKMKVRGARRRKIAPYQRAAGGFDRLGYAAAETTSALTTLITALDIWDDRD